VRGVAAVFRCPALCVSGRSQLERISSATLVAAVERSPAGGLTGAERGILAARTHARLVAIPFALQTVTHDR
jgi:hypothetical protein